MKALTPLFLILATAAPALADVKGPGGKVIDCYCTDSKGARVELGEMICLQVNGRMFMAQCQMSLNNPMWREISEGCLSSGLGRGLQRSEPAGHALTVDAKI
ncbi:hypothetical protein PSA7680_00110 [Pseudoruegeria aquimaris]|uniref:Cyanovirin-N domain-containing protein n=1 Tax=Pseudoruegeria aquimaris TaxID=393663 RepID=A0A1Y5R7X7_9RHOB|nr:hypothetical protein [Pseudoruegeria aquimaris]SLN11194.1 hypothetical protein PSA7680_00110 [Pseudoruegeria aquimaris]